jgi:hypothetical protein
MTTPIKIREACTAFVTHQRERGQKPSTIGTICRTLELLIAEMGEEKEVGKILTVHVDKFYKSEATTMQPGKDGLKPRAKASVLQIRRIVRLALVWWKEQGWLDKIPVPSEDRRLVEKQEHRVTPKPPRQRKRPLTIEDTYQYGESPLVQDDCPPENGDYAAEAARMEEEERKAREEDHGEDADQGDKQAPDPATGE